MAVDFDWFVPLVRGEAEKYDAVKLMEALDEFAKHNSLALNRLQRNWKVGEVTVEGSLRIV